MITSIILMDSPSGYLLAKKETDMPVHMHGRISSFVIHFQEILKLCLQNSKTQALG